MAESIMGRSPDPGAGPEAVDPNDVAACVGAAEERLGVRVRRDPEALYLARALRQDRARERNRRVVAGIAALLLVGLGIGWAVRAAAPPPRSFRERLEAAALALAAGAPDVLGTFALLPLEHPPAPGTTRGAGTWVDPVGILLEPPRVLRWERPLGATRVEVALAQVGGPWEHRREATGESTSDVPTLGPGRYVVRLRGLDSLAGQEVRRTFVVLAPEAAARHRAAIDALRRQAPADLAPFLVAHYALRERLFAEAETALAALSAATEPGAGAEAEALRGHAAAREAAAD